MPWRIREARLRAAEMLEGLPERDGSDDEGQTEDEVEADP